jgi:hypothetical protein
LTASTFTQSADGVTWGTVPFDGWDLAFGGARLQRLGGLFSHLHLRLEWLDVPPYSNAVHSDGL